MPHRLVLAPVNVLRGSNCLNQHLYLGPTSHVPSLGAAAVTQALMTDPTLAVSAATYELLLALSLSDMHRHLQTMLVADCTLCHLLDCHAAVLMVGSIANVQGMQLHHLNTQMVRESLVIIGLSAATASTVLVQLSDGQSRHLCAQPSWQLLPGNHQLCVMTQSWSQPTSECFLQNWMACLHR